MLIMSISSVKKTGLLFKKTTLLILILSIRCVNYEFSVNEHIPTLYGKAETVQAGLQDSDRDSFSSDSCWRRMRFLNSDGLPRK
jgi:hypothetical protein